MFGRGALRNDPTRTTHERPHTELLHTVGASATPRGQASLADYRTARTDQNGYEACTAHALAEGIAQSCAAAGKPLPHVPSMALIWAASKSLERTPSADGLLPALSNVGVQSVSAMLALGTMGIVPMLTMAPDRFSDVQSFTFEVPFDLGQRAAGNLVTGEFSLALGASAPSAIAACLDANLPVYLAADVGPQYMAWVPTMPPLNTLETNPAGHAIILDGYEMNDDGEFVFTSPGSYGIGPADAGIWSVTGQWIVLNGFDCYPLAINGVHYA